MRFLFALLLVFLSTSVIAKDVIIRSGEHPGFSRLAFDFSEPVEWVLVRVENGYEVRLERPMDTIDITDVYRRISHDRVSRIDVSKDNTKITLIIDCECYADAFEFQPGLLVVDIKERLAPVVSSFESGLGSGEVLKKQTQTTDEISETRKTTHVEESVGVDSLSILPVIMHPVQTLPSITKNIGANTGQENQISAPNQGIEKMQLEIFHQIGRAASQGLLDVDISIPESSEIKGSREGLSVDVKEKLIVPHDHINMHITTSVDREFALAMQAQIKTQNGDLCLPGKAFDLAGWGNPDSVLAEIIEQRAIVYGEFDKVNEKAVERLVKAYIYAGFGAEAKSALDAFGVTVKDENILRMMAKIIDGRTHQSHLEFQSQAACNTSAALWAVLAMPEISKEANVNANAILNSFSTFPHHIKQLIGPKLSLRFLSAGDVDTARAIRNSVERSPGKLGSEFRLMDAKLNQERGLHAKAKHSLEQIVNEDSTVAPVALIELLESYLSQDIEINDIFLTTAETHVFEQRNTKVAADLQRLIALLQAKNGEPLLALKTLRELSSTEHFNKPALSIIWGEVLEKVLVLDSRGELLKFIFAAQNDLVKYSISQDTLREVSSVLVEEGLIKIAQKIFGAPRFPTVDDRIILARVEMLKYNLERAVELLKDVSHPKATLLRAQAYSRMGQHLKAANEYANIPDESKRQNEIWRAGDWSQLGQSNIKADTIAASIMNKQSIEIERIKSNAQGVIERYKALIDKSFKARQSLDLLLKEHPSF